MPYASTSLSLFLPLSLSFGLRYLQKSYSLRWVFIFLFGASLLLAHFPCYEDLSTWYSYAYGIHGLNGYLLIFLFPNSTFWPYRLKVTSKKSRSQLRISNVISKETEKRMTRGEQKRKGNEMKWLETNAKVSIELWMAK